jgi:hypothetical protein
LTKEGFGESSGVGDVRHQVRIFRVVLPRDEIHVDRGDEDGGVLETMAVLWFCPLQFMLEDVGSTSAHGF